MSSMALSGETFRKMAAQKNALLMRLAAAEHSADMSAPSKIAFRSGTLYTSQFVIGTLNGYFGNPKVAGLVGYDFVGGMTIHTLGLLARYFAPKITDTVGDTGMAVAHTVADAAIANYVCKVSNAFGMQLRSKTGSPATSGYHGGKYNRMAGVGALTADEASVYVGKH